ncbi:MAG: hypothetical protein AAF541_12625 [Pseudomonadota bacterium]
MTTVAVANIANAQTLLPNCIARIHQFKHPVLPVKKEALRNKTGCLYTINWGINEADKNPDLFDIRSSEACERIGKRLEKAWPKSILYPGEAVAHCQTRLRITCPSRKKPCRYIWQVAQNDPVLQED